MERIDSFKAYLLREEKSPLTIEKYVRDAAAFLHWLGDMRLEKIAVLAYKEAMVQRLATASVNSVLSSLNCFFKFLGRHDCRVKTVKIHRTVYRTEEKELTREEYGRLVRCAQRDERLCLLIQAICATGIRVSEHRFLTVEAARQGFAEVRLKGKQRRIYLPGKLCKALLRYAGKRGIREGSIFVTAGGKPMDRSNIWSRMKALCERAGVTRGKVFPHNLRHLFARCFYETEKDIVRLADILGHASINTTRIYTMESGLVHRRQIEKMQLLLTT